MTSRTPGTIARGAARRIPKRPFAAALNTVLPVRFLRPVFRGWLSLVAAQPDRTRAMRELLELNEDAYSWVDRAAITYDGGVHAKHRLIAYHDFFVERVREGERVLDVGCGKGELAHDLVVRAGATVTGIDLNTEYLKFARARYADPRLTFVEADALEYLPDEPFDVVILSNVLEHIEHRPELLRRIVAQVHPSRVLIRVPVLARDWTVPLREELGLWHFSDATHFVEYDPELFRRELGEAGLDVTELILVWGEIWAEARP